MKLLVADIGGTNARFAYQEKDDGELNNFTYLKCADFENIYDAIEHYQQTNNLDIENMSIALASHTTKDAIKFTNNQEDHKKLEDIMIDIQNKLLVNKTDKFTDIVKLNINIFKNGTYEDYNEIFSSINRWKDK